MHPHLPALSLAPALLCLALSLLPVDLPAADKGGNSRLAVEDREDGRYVIDVQLNTPEEIEVMLTRAETLSREKQLSKVQAGIALVLHGDELKMFWPENRKKYAKLIERAMKLDRENVIEVKACNVTMESLGLKKEDMPDFVEIVPYGPDEVIRLKKRGYMYF